MQEVIERFFARYGVIRKEPDYSLLQSISRSFSYLPYENVTKILKDARSLNTEMKLRSAEEVLEDHLRWGTGGTCFSLCNALKTILKDSGFDAQILMGDMHYGANIHCAVRVSLDSRSFLLDPGYLLHDPIPFPEAGLEVVQLTAMNKVLLVSEPSSSFSLYTEENGQKKWRYRLHGVPVSHEEFVAHWISSFSLNTMENIMLSRINSTGRLYFRKDRLETVNPSSRLKEIVGPDEVPELSRMFGVPANLIKDAQRALRSRINLR